MSYRNNKQEYLKIDQIEDQMNFIFIGHMCRHLPLKKTRKQIPLTRKISKKKVFAFTFRKEMNNLYDTGKLSPIEVG